MWYYIPRNNFDLSSSISDAVYKLKYLKKNTAINLLLNISIIFQSFEKYVFTVAVNIIYIKIGNSFMGLISIRIKKKFKTVTN